MFEIGDQVRCVDAAPPDDMKDVPDFMRPIVEGLIGPFIREWPLENGAVYTVIGFEDQLPDDWQNQGGSVVLEEVKNPFHEIGGYHGFDPRRFRKKIDTSAGMETIREVIKDAEKRAKVIETAWR